MSDYEDNDVDIDDEDIDDDDIDETAENAEEQTDPEGRTSTKPSADSKTAGEAKDNEQDDVEYELPEEEEDVIVEEQPEPHPKSTKLVPQSQRRTMPILTRFERARILGYRATQLSQGAPALVSVGSSGDIDHIAVATEELRRGTLPFRIRRWMPDNTYELWKLNELQVD